MGERSSRPTPASQPPTLTAGPAKMVGKPNLPNSLLTNNGKSNTALSSHIAPIPDSSAKAIAAPPPADMAVMPTSPG